MRKATLRKYKAVRQSSRVLGSRKKISKKKTTVKKSEMEQKLKAMGYTSEVNKRINEMMIDDSQMQDIYNRNLEIEEEMDLKTGQIQKVDYHKKIQKPNVDEKTAIEKLVKKYADDYRKMQMDNKVNVFVWNKKQCQKMHERYIHHYGQIE